MARSASSVMMGVHIHIQTLISYLTPPPRFYHKKNKKIILSNRSPYKIITQEVFHKRIIEGKEPSILVFGAEWSGNSDIMNSMVGRISQEFGSNLHFYKVDVEKQPNIASFFGVSSIPTTIMLKDGEVLGLVKGFTSANKIRKKIKNNYAQTLDENSKPASNQ